MQKTTPWIVKAKDYPKKPSEVNLRLFCFPQAGSSASMYREWQTSFPINIEVLPIEYPGHNSRMREPLAKSMDELVKGLVDGILHLIREGVPFAFFGHSLGGWVAFETAQALQTRGGPHPIKIHCSAIRSPSTAKNDIDPIVMHKIENQEEFWNMMNHRYGTCTDIDPALQELMYPIIKSDFRITETYRPSTFALNTPLQSPLCILGGKKDTRYIYQQLEQWIDHVDRSSAADIDANFSIMMFEGGHNYAFNENESKKEIIDFLIQDLNKVIQRQTERNAISSNTNEIASKKGIIYDKDDKDGSVHSFVSDAMATVGSATSHVYSSTAGAGVASHSRIGGMSMTRDGDDGGDEWHAPEPERVNCFQCVFCRR